MYEYYLYVCTCKKYIYIYTTYIYMPMYVCIHGVFSKKGFLPHTSGSLGLKVRFKLSPCFTTQSVQCCVMKWFSKGARGNSFN